MDRMAVTQDFLLSNAWMKAVREGKIVNEFKAPNGDRIRFGLIFQNGCIEYHARNIETGCEMPALVEEKMIGQSSFMIQFNGYRALKPGSKILSIGKQPDIPGEAASCRFYCQDPSRTLSILKRDPLIQIALPNYKWNGYYNVTPFEKEGHFLWLPVFTKAATISHIRQELSCAFLEDALALFENSDRLMIFFNSLHAGASVNHIHLQAIFHKKALSIEGASIIRRGRFTVLDNYPARGIVFDRGAGSDEIWPCIDYLQKNGIPFNLIFVGDRICLIPRNPLHEVAAELPTNIIASAELAGKIITVDRNVYDNMNYAIIQKAFQKTTVEYYSV